jgi:hypothetical protein
MLKTEVHVILFHTLAHFIPLECDMTTSDTFTRTPQNHSFPSGVCESLEGWQHVLIILLYLVLPVGFVIY